MECDAPRRIREPFAKAEKRHSVNRLMEILLQDSLQQDCQYQAWNLTVFISKPFRNSELTLSRYTSYS
jgi:hypothetical protein